MCREIEPRATHIREHLPAEALDVVFGPFVPLDCASHVAASLLLVALELAGDHEIVHALRASCRLHELLLCSRVAFESGEPRCCIIGLRFFGYRGLISLILCSSLIVLLFL